MLYLIEKNEFVKTLILILLIFLVSCSGGGSKNIDTEPDQEPLSIASLEIYLENPIYQDITRSVFFKSNYETDIQKIIFSTLESYKPDGSDHNFLMVSSEFDSSGIKNSETIKIVNSREE